MEDIKVGDMVKVVRRPNTEENKSFGWVMPMDNMIGNIYKVTSIKKDPEYYLVNGYIIHRNCCEKIPSNDVIMSKYSYKGVTDFDKIIEDNKDELAFIVKGKENFVVGLDKRIQSIHIIHTDRIFYEDKDRFWPLPCTNNTKFNFGVFSMTQFDGVKSEIFQSIKEFKSRTVKKVYTFK